MKEVAGTSSGSGVVEVAAVSRLLNQLYSYHSLTEISVYKLELSWNTITGHNNLSRDLAYITPICSRDEMCNHIILQHYN